MKVAILGTVPASKHLAPFSDPSWEIWVCSPGNRGKVFPRVTKWFELHGVVDLKGVENAAWNDEYFAWLRDQPFPVFMQEPNDLVPQSIPFPIKPWLAEFGKKGRAAATSSISLMIGFAIMSGATEIGVFGVDMAAHEEAYTLQKSGCTYMLLEAEERGIKISVPLESCLGTMPPLYGYAEASRMGRKLLVREMETANLVANIKAQIENAQAQLHFTEGALETTRYMRRTFVDGEHDAEIDLPALPELTPARTDQFEQTVYGSAAENGIGAATDLSKIAGVIPETSPERMSVEKTPGGVLVPEGTRKRGNGARTEPA